MMLQSIRIKGFRGIKALDVEGLARVTVFTGLNGAGKSTMLEAAFTLYGRMNPAWVLNLQAHRGFAGITARGPNYAGLFYGFRDVGVASITGKFSNRQTWTVELERSKETAHSPAGRASRASTDVEAPLADLACRAYRGKKLMHRSSLVWELDPPNQPRPAVKGGAKAPETALLMHPSDRVAGSEEEVRFGDARVGGRGVQLVDTLRTLDEQITDVEFLRTSMGDYFVANLNGIRAPLGMLGGGINNLFRFLVGLDYTRGGWLGIDEVENGFHHSRLVAVFARLFEASREGHTQLMMSTHSAEALGAIVNAAEPRNRGDLAVVHLRRDEDDSVRAKVFRGRDAVAALDLGYELR